MRLAKENLGKVSVTVEKDYHNIEKEYDKLVVVEEEGQFRTFISRKPVPIGIELTNREYWLPFSSVKESIVIDYNKFKQYIRTGEGLLDDSIVERHIKNRNITGDKIAENTITFVNIADNTITLNKINNEAIDTTLTKEGHLAEAKHTGDRLLNIEGLSVIKVPSTQSTVLDAWQLIDKKGNIHGVTINTYKDKSINAIWLSVNEDDPQLENPEVKVDNPKYLNIIYNKADGTQQKVSIPLASFVTEAEFSKNGFKVIDGVVNLKISSDITTSRYFHFDVDGNITLDGFEERILEDLGTLEHSEFGDGTMWGEFKKQEAIREEVSNSVHQVFADNWDVQDDDPTQWEDPIATESNIAYNWKTTDTPASDGKTEGNLKDLYQKIINQDEKLSELEIEVIYDVSAHNGGTVFESLSALLSSSNLSTLIPTSVRHGGMTIRFIKGSKQSSDNKYVQYRLMSNAFNTTVDNWQGVDDEPTAGSNNLVKSGSVFNINGGTCRINIFNTSSEHSSENDRIKIFIPANTIFSVTPVDNSAALNSFNVFVRYKGSLTFVKVLGKVIDGKPCFVATNDIEEIGLYFITTIRGLVHFEIKIISINDRLVDIENTKLCNCFIGNNSTYSQRNIYGLIRGNTYRVYLKTTTWDITDTGSDVTALVFAISSYNINNVETLLVLAKIRDYSTIKPYYDVTIPTDSEYVVIGGRAALSEKVVFSIVDITKSNSDYSEIDTQLNELSFATGYNSAKVQEGVLAVGSWYRVGFYTSTDCLGYRNKFKVQPGSTLNCVHAKDIKIRIVQFGESGDYLTQNETYSYIDSVILRNDTYYVAISASYSERGYSDENPISLSDFVTGDFGIILPSADVVKTTEQILSNSEKDKVLENLGINRENTVLFGAKGFVSSEALYNSIGGESSIVFDARSEHSSYNDRIEVDIKEGESFKALVETINPDSTLVLTSLTLYIQYKGESEYTSIGHLSLGTIHEFTAEKDIVSAGIYFIATNPDYIKFSLNHKSLRERLLALKNNTTIIGNAVNNLENNPDIVYNEKEFFQRLKAVQTPYDKYGQNYSSGYIGIMFVTDTHNSLSPINKALSFNKYDEINAVVHLGDVFDGSGYYPNSSWVENLVLSSSKPVIVIPGNHEFEHIADSDKYVGFTDEQALNIFCNNNIIQHNGEIHPTINGVLKNYFYKDITNDFGTLRLIFLYQFEWNAPDATYDLNDKEYVCYSQEQIDWLVNILQNTPSDYCVMILSHVSINKIKCEDNPFVPSSRKNITYTSEYNFKLSNPCFFYNIIEAFVNGGNCITSCNQVFADGIHNINVNTTFEGGGKFVGNICGHEHSGNVGYMVTENDLVSPYRVLVLPTSSTSATQQDGWWVRGTGYIYDCLNAIVYDFKRDKLKMVRYGSYINNDGEDAKVFSF